MKSSPFVQLQHCDKLLQNENVHQLLIKFFTFSPISWYNDILDVNHTNWKFYLQFFFQTSTAIYQSSTNIENYQIVIIFCLHHSVLSPQRRYEYLWNGLYMQTILVLKFYNLCWEYINTSMLFLLHFIPNPIYFIHNLFM